MDFRTYAAFLPPAYTADMTAPTSTWSESPGTRRT